MKQPSHSVRHLSEPAPATKSSDDDVDAQASDGAQRCINIGGLPTETAVADHATSCHVIIIWSYTYIHINTYMHAR